MDGFFGGNMNFDKIESDTIQEIVKDLMEENNFVNRVVRDDVFAELEKYCTVLYFPLEDGIDGCHKRKNVNGKTEQFVFINTNKMLQEQVFTAAHELGHIWKVDKIFKKKMHNDKYDSEIIIGRFAAELLMPKDLFVKQTKNKLKEMGYDGKTITFGNLLELIAYLMNYFCVPFKSIVLRFNECKMLEEKNNEAILRYADSEVLKSILEKNHYTRLNKVNKSISMKDIGGLIKNVEDSGLFNERKIETIKRLFKLDQDDTELGEEINVPGLGESNV